MSLARVRTRRYGAKVNPLTRAQWVGATVLVAGLLIGGAAYAMKTSATAAAAKKWTPVPSKQVVKGKTYRWSETLAAGATAAGGPYKKPANATWAEGIFWTSPPADWPAGGSGGARQYNEAVCISDDLLPDDADVWVQG